MKPRTTDTGATTTGATGATDTGATGERWSLEPQEQRQILEPWRATGRDDRYRSHERQEIPTKATTNRY